MCLLVVVKMDDLSKSIILMKMTKDTVGTWGTCSRSQGPATSLVFHSIKGDVRMAQMYVDFQNMLPCCQH